MESYTHTGFGTLTLLEGGLTPRLRLTLPADSETNLGAAEALALLFMTVKFRALREIEEVFDISWPRPFAFEFSVRLESPVRNPRGFLKKWLQGKIIAAQAVVSPRYCSSAAVLALARQLEIEGLLPFKIK